MRCRRTRPGLDAAEVAGVPDAVADIDGGAFPGEEVVCPLYESALLLYRPAFERSALPGLLVLRDVSRDPIDDVLLLAAREL